MNIMILIMGQNIFKLQLKKFNGYIYTELQELETSVPVPVSKKETNIETFFIFIMDLQFQLLIHFYEQ